MNFLEHRNWFWQEDRPSIDEIPAECNAETYATFEERVRQESLILCKCLFLQRKLCCKNDIERTQDEPTQ